MWIKRVNNMLINSIQKAILKIVDQINTYICNVNVKELYGSVPLEMIFFLLPFFSTLYPLSILTIVPMNILIFLPTQSVT